MKNLIQTNLQTITEIESRLMNELMNNDEIHPISEDYYECDDELRNSISYCKSTSVEDFDENYLSSFSEDNIDYYLTDDAYTTTDNDSKITEKPEYEIEKYPENYDNSFDINDFENVKFDFSENFSFVHTHLVVEYPTSGNFRLLNSITISKSHSAENFDDNYCNSFDENNLDYLIKDTNENVSQYYEFESCSESEAHLLTEAA